MAETLKRVYSSVVCLCVFSCFAVASSGGQSVSRICCSTSSGVQSGHECPNTHHPPSPAYASSVPAATAHLTHAPQPSQPNPARRARCLPDHTPRAQRSPHTSHGALCHHQLIVADQRPAEPSRDVRRAADAEDGWIREI